MSKEIVRAENRQISQVGETLLEMLRQTWGKREVTRTVTTKDENGNAVFAERTFQVESSNKRLNKGVAPARFHHFAGLVKAEDEERIGNIIRAGCFEVEKAIQAFEIAPKVAVDRRIVPKTWEQAKALNSPSLATLVKYKGEDKAAELVYMMLFSFARKFGRRNDLQVSEEVNDIRELALDVVAQYRRLSIGDLKMILTNTLKVSKKRFNLDHQGVMQAIEESYEDKLEHFSRVAESEHARMTGDEKQYRSRREAHGMDAEGIGLVVQSMAQNEQAKS